MAAATLGAVRKVFELARGPAGGDGELLTRFRSGRDPDAFGWLVRRHGPMVLGVCRRVLRDAHAADDAFQATFLVLARRAGAVRPPDRLAPWLYGVAYRTALKARGRAFRRRQVEADYAAQAPGRAAAPGGGADLLPLIDEQVNALPEKYRDPLVLCGVQGLNKAEAATRLGLPEGTVSSRLARAREMLRDRLTRRGVAVPAAGFAAVLTADALHAAVPPALAKAAAATAARSAAAPAAVLTLSTEVLRSMTLLNLKCLGAIAVSVSLAGGGFGLVATGADEKKPAAEKPAAKPEKPGDKPAAAKPAPDGEKPKPAAPDGDGEKPAAPRKNRRVILGQVGAVDAGARTVTLLRTDGGGLREEAVKVREDAKVLVDGKEVNLADVPKGATAELGLVTFGKEGSPPIASEVWVDGSKLVGVIKAAGATTLTLLGGGAVSKLPDRVLKLAPAAEVVVNGKAAKPTDLQPGDVATVTLGADRTTATAVAVKTRTGPGDGEKPARPDGGKAPAGKPVAAVDPAANTIALVGKTDGGGAPVVRVAAGAKVYVDGKEAKLADVPRGSVVTFGGQRDGSKEVGEVRAVGETITGVLRQVDLASVTVTVKGEKGKGGDRVLKLAEGGKVTAGGKDVKLTDLKEGDVATVTLTADGSAALAVVAGPGKAGGDKSKPEKEDE
jgi:RNA polymerase sigma factor (sigma-70 family)